MKTKSKKVVVRKSGKHLPRRKVNEITKDLKSKQVYYLNEPEVDEFDIRHIRPL